MIYTKQNIEEFLIALDSELDSKQEIIVIGGAAATLHYNSKEDTIDIDTYNSIESLKEAYRKVVEKLPNLKIPLSAAAPVFGPVNITERLEESSEVPLENLKIFVPEVHDWILLKTARSDEKDITDIKDVASLKEIDHLILKERFKTEMLPYNPGNDELLVSAYLYMISILFSEAVAKEHQDYID